VHGNWPVLPDRFGLEVRNDPEYARQLLNGLSSGWLTDRRYRKLARWLRESQRDLHILLKEAAEKRILELRSNIRISSMFLGISSPLALLGNLLISTRKADDWRLYLLVAGIVLGLVFVGTVFALFGNSYEAIFVRRFARVLTRE